MTRVKGVASIAVTLESLTLADGRTVQLSTSQSTRGEDDQEEGRHEDRHRDGNRRRGRGDRGRRQGCRDRRWCGWRCGHRRRARHTRRSGGHSRRNPRALHAQNANDNHRITRVQRVQRVQEVQGSGEDLEPLNPVNLFLHLTSCFKFDLQAAAKRVRDRALAFRLFRHLRELPTSRCPAVLPPRP